MHEDSFGQISSKLLLAKAEALGFSGEFPIDAWVRARTVRFSMLACVKRARDTEQMMAAISPLEIPAWLYVPATVLTPVAALPDALISEQAVPFISEGFALD